MTDKLPALETPCQSEVVHQKLSATQFARKAFAEAESSEKINQALRHQTCLSTPRIFQNGDSVYYKRDSLEQWKDPGTVIGIENQTVVIKHGSIYVRVHPCRVMHENSKFQAKEIKGQKDNFQEMVVKQGCNDLTMSESLDSDPEENNQQKDIFDEINEPIHSDNRITTISEQDLNTSEIMNQEVIENSGMDKY